MTVPRSAVTIVHGHFKSYVHEPANVKSVLNDIGFEPSLPHAATSGSGSLLGEAMEAANGVLGLLTRIVRSMAPRART